MTPAPYLRKIFMRVTQNCVRSLSAASAISVAASNRNAVDLKFDLQFLRCRLGAAAAN